MCDTFVQLRQNGFRFAKNSDRSPNEPNLCIFVPAHKTGRPTQQCTYIEIPNVAKKNAIVMIKPSWMWGAEMGINEHGVVIGNEAVFTKAKHRKDEALLGMDLLRLALERATSAKEAGEIIVALLQAHGQGGNAGFDRILKYDNSFLISDPKESLVLEIYGADWAVRNVPQNVNISNRLPVKGTIIASSLPDHQAFPTTIQEPVFSFFSGSKDRQCQIASTLDIQPDLSVNQLFGILKSHHHNNDKSLFSKGSPNSVCMHKSLLGDHTTGSFVVDATDSLTTIWIANGSTPCLAVYVPTYFGMVAPPVFTKETDALSYWLDREYVRRGVYAGLIDAEAFREEAETLQLEFLTGDALLRIHGSTPLERSQFQSECAAKEAAWIASYQDIVDALKAHPERLPKPWGKLTSQLGKHPFEVDYGKRNAK